MLSPEREFAAALRRRRSLIADEKSRRDPERHVAKLQAVSEKIVLLQERLPQPIDPQLAHFLARCSYDKALEFLEAKL
ncbi:MAG: hypothetical protein H0X34_14145 [Chthoniobacterales bacterium]|nr:hypothetical protein [Chthoniobacterales bacterium]